MKRSLKLGLIGLLTLVGCASLSTPAVRAEEGENEKPAVEMTISPLRSRLTIEAGKVYSGTGSDCPVTNEKKCTLEVSNTGRESFSFRVYASPYSVLSEDSLNITESTTYTQIARWIKFRNDAGEWVDEFTREIVPGETYIVNYQISVPDDIPAGSQYAAIWAQTVPKEAMQTTGVQTVSQAGLIVTASGTGETREEAEITDYHFTGFTMSGAIKAHAKVKNTGNTDYAVKYTYTARSFFGRELFKEEKQITAYPEVELEVNSEWENHPWFGLYTASWKVEAASSIENHSKMVLILPFPMLILLILLLTALGFWIRIIVRKRKERKLKKLI